MHILVDDITIEIIRKPIKNMYLRIYPADGCVKLTAPLKLPLATIDKHITAKREWIRTMHTRYANSQKPVPFAIKDNDPLFIWGQRYQIKIHENSLVKKIEVSTEHIHCYLTSNSTPDEVKNLLTHWYKQQMQLILPDLIAKWERIIGVKLEKYTLRSMKTRWGSCNPRKKSISLNLNLIHKSIPCLESVLVHELTHFFEANHGKRFYALMTKFMPDWKTHQLELK
jgi:predicted metal-dependent hydrolase